METNKNLKGLYINDIPVDLFMKYFDSTAINGLKYIPLLREVKPKGYRYKISVTGYNDLFSEGEVKSYEIDLPVEEIGYGEVMFYLSYDLHELDRKITETEGHTLTTVVEKTESVFRKTITSDNPYGVITIERNLTPNVDGKSIYSVAYDNSNVTYQYDKHSFIKFTFPEEFTYEEKKKYATEINLENFMTYPPYIDDTGTKRSLVDLDRSYRLGVELTYEGDNEYCGVGTINGSGEVIASGSAIKEKIENGNANGYIEYLLLDAETPEIILGKMIELLPVKEQKENPKGLPLFSDSNGDEVVFDGVPSNFKVHNSAFRKGFFSILGTNNSYTYKFEPGMAGLFKSGSKLYFSFYEKYNGSREYLEVNKGTALPASGSNGDFFIKTDENIVYYYENESWAKKYRLFSADAYSGEDRNLVQIPTYFRDPAHAQQIIFEPIREGTNIIDLSKLKTISVYEVPDLKTETKYVVRDSKAQLIAGENVKVDLYKKKAAFNNFRYEISSKNEVTIAGGLRRNIFNEKLAEFLARYKHAGTVFGLTEKTNVSSLTNEIDATRIYIQVLKENRVKESSNYPYKMVTREWVEKIPYTETKTDVWYDLIWEKKKIWFVPIYIPKLVKKTKTYTVEKYKEVFKSEINKIKSTEKNTLYDLIRSNYKKISGKNLGASSNSVYDDSKDVIKKVKNLEEEFMAKFHKKTAEIAKNERKDNTREFQIEYLEAAVNQAYSFADEYQDFLNDPDSYFVNLNVLKGIKTVYKLNSKSKETTIDLEIEDSDEDLSGLFYYIFEEKYDGDPERSIAFGIQNNDDPGKTTPYNLVYNNAHYPVNIKKGKYVATIPMVIGEYPETVQRLAQINLVDTIVANGVYERVVTFKSFSIDDSLIQRKNPREYFLDKSMLNVGNTYFKTQIGLDFESKEYFITKTSYLYETKEKPFQILEYKTEGITITINDNISRDDINTLKSYSGKFLDLDKSKFVNNLVKSSIDGRVFIEEVDRNNRFFFYIREVSRNKISIFYIDHDKEFASEFITEETLIDKFNKMYHYFEDGYYNTRGKRVSSDSFSKEKRSIMKEMIKSYLNNGSNSLLKRQAVNTSGVIQQRIIADGYYHFLSNDIEKQKKVAYTGKLVSPEKLTERIILQSINSNSDAILADKIIVPEFESINSVQNTSGFSRILEYEKYATNYDRVKNIQEELSRERNLNNYDPTKTEMVRNDAVLNRPTPVKNSTDVLSLKDDLIGLLTSYFYEYNEERAGVTSTYVSSYKSFYEKKFNRLKNSEFFEDLDENISEKFVYSPSSISDEDYQDLFKKLFSKDSTIEILM